MKTPKLNILAVVLVACIAVLTTASCKKSEPEPQKQTGTKTTEQTQAEGTQVALKPQTSCPVMGGKINKEQYVDVKGYRIYVCCPGCTDKIEENPEKYIEKLREQGERPVRLAELKETGGETHGEHEHHEH